MSGKSALQTTIASPAAVGVPVREEYWRRSRCWTVPYNPLATLRTSDVTIPPTFTLYTDPESMSPSAIADENQDRRFQSGAVISLGKAQHQRTHGETQTIILDFLQRSKYILHSTPRNAVLRTSIIECLLSWQSADTEETLAKFAETACDYTETGYGHLSPVHQHFVALYTAIILHIDDIGEQHLDAIKQFASRLTCGEKQLCPALDALVQLLRQAHELWTDVGADAIIAGTLDSVTAMYIENTTRDMEIKPKATLYPYYLRTRSGICPPYIHFIFMKHWRPTTKSYLQMLPYMERWVVGANDILSFYKEELAGETKNYIHMCAAAEQLTPANALRTLANEVLNHTHTIIALAGEDIELASLWEQYVQRVLEFHINTRRYRLSELDLDAVYGQRADGDKH